MTNSFELAVIAYVENRSPENLSRLDQAILEAKFLVAVSQDAVALEGVAWDIPAVCLRRADGKGVLPIFTTVANLLSWKSEGPKYVELGGRTLIRMARDMAGIEEIEVNPRGAPRGAIPRSEFDRLLSL
jgi:hypothetical protein